MHHDQIMRIIYLLVWLLLIVGGGNIAVRRLKANPGMATRYALLWLAIIAGLALFYYAMRRLS